MPDHSLIEQHAPVWAFFAVNPRFMYRGCQVCGEVEAIAMPEPAMRERPVTPPVPKPKP